MKALLVLAVLVLLAGCGDEEEAPSAAPPSDPVVRELRQGGLTLVIRHAKADNEIAKQEKLGDCTLQRNLTVAGQDQAREIGRQVRRLKVPIGEVLASPLCRAHDTAQLAFGRVTDEEDLLSPGVTGTQADDERRAGALRALVEAPPARGENRVLVTHTGNIGAALGEETVAEGETLVYGSGARLVGRVPAEGWAGLR